MSGSPYLCKYGEPDIYIHKYTANLTFTLHLTLKMTTAKGVETSVTSTNTNSPSQDYTNLDDQHLATNM